MYLWGKLSQKASKQKVKRPRGYYKQCNAQMDPGLNFLKAKQIFLGKLGKFEHEL